MFARWDWAHWVAWLGSLLSQRGDHLVEARLVLVLISSRHGLDFAARNHSNGRIEIYRPHETLGGVPRVPKGQGTWVARTPTNNALGAGDTSHLKNPKKQGNAMRKILQTAVALGSGFVLALFISAGPASADTANSTTHTMATSAQPASNGTTSAATSVAVGQQQSAHPDCCAVGPYFYHWYANVDVCEFVGRENVYNGLWLDYECKFSFDTALWELWY